MSNEDVMLVDWYSMMSSAHTLQSIAEMQLAFDTIRIQLRDYLKSKNLIGE